MNETTNVDKAEEHFFDMARLIYDQVGFLLSSHAIYNTAAIFNLALRYNRKIDREDFVQPATEFAIGMGCTGLSAIF